jgi:RimJ/RimL family protein N-acetyltransferase
MARDADMMRHVTGYTWEEDKVDAFLERQALLMERHGVCFLAMTAHDDNDIIGLVGMQPLDDGRFEIGWWIWRDYWRQGYALEGAQAMLPLAWETMALPELLAVIDPDNAASRAVAERLGMSLAGVVPASETRAERPDTPVLLYQMNNPQVASAL